MRLFLVRHGETVDNVAGIYAGTRDSPLTAHGVLQARRLAAHLAARSSLSSSAAAASGIGPVRHVFTSDLRRAVETAQAVVDALASGGNKLPASAVLPSASDVQEDSGNSTPAGSSVSSLRVVQCSELRERDFGLAEGKKFGAVAPGGLASLGAETREQMRVRAEKFVRDFLAPVLAAQHGAVVVVAHGLILDALLRVLLAQFGPAELARLADQRTVGWSNTGYVELLVRADDNSTSSAAVDVDGAEAEAVDEPAAVASGDRTPPQPLPPRITLSVAGVNVLKHLEGLKKTRGGIGSAQFDKRQRTMDSFFAPAAKKAKVERQLDEA